MEIRDYVIGVCNLAPVFYSSEKHTLHIALQKFVSREQLHRSIEATIFEHCEIVAKFHIADYLDEEENRAAFFGLQKWIGENLMEGE